MSADIIQLGTAKPVETAGMLEILELLRQDIVDGKVVAFAVAGLSSTDEARGWTGCQGQSSVSRLRVAGAIAYLQQAYLSGAI